MLDVNVIDSFLARDGMFQHRPQAGDVPLAVAQVIQ